MDKVYFVYMTAGNRSEAMSIGNELVSHRLVACVNIIGQMSSIYRWEGEIHYGEEVVLIAKTTAPNLPELVEIVKSNHSYDCPCIVYFPISGGNRQFLDWIAGEVIR